MSLVKNASLGFLTFFSALMLWVVLPTINLHASDCNSISKDLNDSYNSYQDKGGLWTLLEKSEALRAKSMIGMQTDSKLRRSITIYENHCQANPKSSNVEMARRIADLLDGGRMITNNNPNNVSAKKIMQSIETLLAKANKLLAEIEK